MRTLLLLLVGLLISCANEPERLVSSFFPEERLLKDGVVSKYYEHFYPDEASRESYTNIIYTLTKRKSADQFTIEWFNAGFELTKMSKFSIQDGIVSLDSNVSFVGFSNLDTMVSDIKNAFYQDWNNPESEQSLIEFRDFDGDRYEIEQTQTRSRDSTILDKPAKIFIGNRTIKSLKRDQIFDQKYASIYVQGLGLYSFLSTRNDGRFVTELIEQMPYSDFKKLSRHDKHRVAYIDPLNTIDDALYFELCGHEKGIFDYYNSTPDVRYADGKGQMKKIIKSKLEREKLQGQSGYLTFRFVVNCKGETGRYVIEQSDLDYQKKRFPKETVDHLYGITYSLNKWEPAVIREEGRDAYVYLTYKLQNGVVTDVLP